MDVVEVSPPYDHAEMTAYLGGRVVLEALAGDGLAAASRAGRRSGGPRTRCLGALSGLGQGVDDLGHHLDASCRGARRRTGPPAPPPSWSGPRSRSGWREVVRPGVVVGPGPAGPAEQHHRELGLAHQLDVAGGLDQPGRLPRRGEHRLDGVAVGVGAVDGEREPQRQAPGPPGQVEGVVARVERPAPRRPRGRPPGTRRAGRAPAGPPRGRGRGAPRSRTARTATCGGRPPSSRRARCRRSAAGPRGRRAPRRRRRRRRGTTARGRRATSATPARSSTIPALVVPAVATTPTTDSSPASASVASSAAPVSRWSSAGTSSGSAPITCRALADRGVGLLADRDQRPGSDVRPRGPAVSRATRSAERLPIEPPETKQPPAESGRPAKPASTDEGLVLGPHRAGRLEPGGALERRARDDHVEEERRLGRHRRDEGQKPRAVRRDDGRGQLVLEDRRGPSRGRSGPARSGRRARGGRSAAWPPKSSGTGSRASRRRQ